MSWRYHPYDASRLSSRSAEKNKRSDDDNHSFAFCKCYSDNDYQFPSINFRKHLCICGEDATDKMEWSWDAEVKHSESQITGSRVIFHPIYSQGTSIIRGDTPLQLNRHHYWEIKILSSLSGTDIMIGVGTEDIRLCSYQYKFASALGLDENSWGYSYRGLVQHNGRLKYYGKKFTQGCIVGVYLDLVRGTLEFYLNRKPQGRAYLNIPLNSKTKYYPMACSTSAKSSIKLINATSFVDNLQFSCMKVISKYPKQIEELHRVPGLKYLCDDLWFLQSKEQYRYEEFQKNNLLLEDEALLCGLKKEQINIINSDEDSSSTDEIYNFENFPKKETPVNSDDDDDEAPQVFFNAFCEHF